MRIMMISEIDLSSHETLGVTKKLSGQFKAFSNLGHDVFHLCLQNGDGVLVSNDGQRTVVPAKRKAFLTVISLLRHAPELCKAYRIDMCYIRYPLADWDFMRMIRALHGICNVLVEIPTFPYDAQNKNIRGTLARVRGTQDRVFREHMARHVDYIVTYSDDSQIFGVPCINISNGIDVSEVCYLGDKLVYGDAINLIGVARLQRDHGYDRVIEGMRRYYAKSSNPRSIVFHIVGTGDAEKELREAVAESGLSDKVFFYGRRTGKALEDLYLGSQIAVGILGGFRSGLEYTSALKNREYCAIGIPFIGACVDRAIPSNVGWCKLLDNNESPIDIEEVISFFDVIRRSPRIHGQMREFAESQMTWESQFSKVISYLS